MEYRSLRLTMISLYHVCASLNKIIYRVLGPVLDCSLKFAATYSRDIQG